MNIPSRFIRLLSICNLLLVSVKGSLVNITADDTNPDPLTGATFTYAPSGRWHDGNGCDGCVAHVDPSLTHDATWHDTTFDRTVPDKAEVQTAQFQFNGSALYVYGILSQSLTNPISTADYTFLIDGQQVGGFTYTPPGNPGRYTYHALLYANHTMPAGVHTFVLQNGRPGGITSLILLDYVQYTRELEDATPLPTSIPSSSPGISNSSAATSTGPTETHTSAISRFPSESPHSQASNTRTIVIASVVAPTIVAIVLVLVLYICCRRRNNLRKRGLEESGVPVDSADIAPYTMRGRADTTNSVTSPPKERVDQALNSASSQRPTLQLTGSSIAETSSVPAVLEDDLPPDYATVYQQHGL